MSNTWGRDLRFEIILGRGSKKLVIYCKGSLVPDGLGTTVITLQKRLQLQAYCLQFTISYSIYQTHPFSNIISLLPQHLTLPVSKVAPL
jgi:hypothetical protein